MVSVKACDNDSNCDIFSPLSLQAGTTHTVESAYLAHAPDEPTTATCALDNGTRGLASNTLLTRPLYDIV